MSVAVGIVGLAFLIFVHECGHFFTARAVGMRPRKFYVGFPPALAKVRRKGIEYGVGAIPLGGYVKVPGMHRPAPTDVDVHFARAVAEAPQLAGPAERVKARLAAGDMGAAARALEALDTAVGAAELSEPASRGARRGRAELHDALGADAYWRQRTWKKVAFIFAGPATNLVLAVALLAAVFMIGIPVAATGEVRAVSPGTPAERVGLQRGDVIVEIDGRRVSGDGVRDTIHASGGRPLLVTVERGGRRVELGPVRAERVDDGYRLGFKPGVVYERSGPGEAARLATEQTWDVTKAIGRSLGRLVTGEGRKDVSSPVGIVQGSSQALEAGFRYYLQVLALISLSLALLNLLPLLPLDGGHITFSIIEGVRGRALGREVYERVSLVGIALVLFLFAVGLSNDIDRLNGG